MLKYLILAVLAVVESAPSGYVLLTPHAHPLQLQPTIKLQNSVLQPPSAFARIPQKAQTFIYQPNSPYLDYPLVALKQDGGETNWIIQGGQNFYQLIFGGGTTEEMPEAEKPAGETPAPTDSSKFEQQFQFEKDAETIPMRETPAATMPMSMLDKKYYILSGQPQFYGNFDAFRNPIFSVQTLQPIRARAALNKEDQPILQSRGNEQIVQLQPFAPVVPLQAGVKLQLRSGIDQPIVGEAPAVRPASFEARSQFDDPSPMNQPESSMKEEASKPMPSTLSDDPSVASTKPAAIAISGEGGLASASPSGTSIVGKEGLALSAPQAIAVSGDFLSEDDEPEPAMMAEPEKEEEEEEKQMMKE